ncbi:MAG: hypothetical protein QXL33_04700 [Sulfolobaceae archaeon]
MNLEKSEKIIAIRVDGKMSYNFSPDVIPARVKNFIIEIGDVKLDYAYNKKHIIEIITYSGKYFKYII